MVLRGVAPSPSYTNFNGTCTVLTYFEKTGVTTDDVRIIIGIIIHFYFMLLLIYKN